MTRRHRCTGCRKRGTFDELVEHIREEHTGYVSIERPYSVYYPHKTEQMKLDTFVEA